MLDTEMMALRRLDWGDGRCWRSDVWKLSPLRPSTVPYETRQHPRFPHPLTRSLFLSTFSTTTHSPFLPSHTPSSSVSGSASTPPAATTKPIQSFTSNVGPVGLTILSTTAHAYTLDSSPTIQLFRLEFVVLPSLPKPIECPPVSPSSGRPMPFSFPASSPWLPRLSKLQHCPTLVPSSGMPTILNVWSRFASHGESSIMAIPRTRMATGLATEPELAPGLVQAPMIRKTRIRALVRLQRLRVRALRHQQRPQLRQRRSVTPGHVTHHTLADPSPFHRLRAVTP